MAHGDTEFGRVDEGDAALTGAATGALAGSPAGPLGIAAGAVIGAGIGIFGASAQNEASRKAEQEKAEALHKANIFKDVAKKQVASLRQTGRNLGAGTPSNQPKPQAIPTGSTPTAAIGQGISSSGTF